MLTLIWILSVVYCIWKLIKGYKRNSMDGVTGVTSGLETIMILIFAPLFMAVDLVVTWVMIIVTSREKNKQ